LVGIVCAAGLTLEGVILFVPTTPPPNVPGPLDFPELPIVSIVDVDLTPTYLTNNQTTNYFLVQSDCGCEPVNISPGQEFRWWVVIANTDSVSHHLEEVEVYAPFLLLQTTPSPPLLLPAHGSVNVTLTIQTPTQGGEYDMTGALDASP
jgi:hypothetical protein